MSPDINRLVIELTPHIKLYKIKSLLLNSGSIMENTESQKAFNDAALLKSLE